MEAPWKIRGVARTYLLIGLFSVAAAVLWMLMGWAVAKLQWGSMSQNAGSIHIAALEKGGLPGDLKAGGEISGLAGFVEQIVRSGALSPRDLHIFAAPGFKPYTGSLDANGHLSPPFTDENCAYKIYRVRESDPPNTVFLVSKKPLKGGGFIVMRRGGDVAVYKQLQNAPGPLPGGGTVESAENCLNP